MTLQQLRYVVKIAESGSFQIAANKLYLSQPNLSHAVRELEKEMQIHIFHRTGRGVVLTEEGRQFLAYARQVVDSADLLEQHYREGAGEKRVFSVSAQHYAFVVNAFVALVEEYREEKYTFSLRESRTYDILEDVHTGRSEIGVIYLSPFNRDVLSRYLREKNLTFTSEFIAKPHVFVSRKNPLAKKSVVTLEELSPYPRLTYDQKDENSFYLSEELYSTRESPKNIVVSDRATLFNLLIGLNGYTICSGIMSEDLNGTQIVSIPLESDDFMEIGYLTPDGKILSHMAKRYLEHLHAYIREIQGE